MVIVKGVRFSSDSLFVYLGKEIRMYKSFVAGFVLVVWTTVLTLVLVSILLVASNMGVERLGS